eukprot:scaffold1854_cov113-Isochrysis_galbana.AAC.15
MADRSRRTQCRRGARREAATAGPPRRHPAMLTCGLGGRGAAATARPRRHSANGAPCPTRSRSAAAAASRARGGRAPRSGTGATAVAAAAAVAGVGAPGRVLGRRPPWRVPRRVKRRALPPAYRHHAPRWPTGVARLTRTRGAQPRTPRCRPATRRARRRRRPPRVRRRCDCPGLPHPPVGFPPPPYRALRALGR